MFSFALTQMSLLMSPCIEIMSLENLSALDQLCVGMEARPNPDERMTIVGEILGVAHLRI
jgi:hypothetical protein